MTQKQALNILKLGHNVFLTGPAGSGKTFILNSYINFLKNNKVSVGVTASTGIAATHMNGMTIHSWSGLGIKDQLSKKDIKNLLKNSRLKKRFAKTKVLIIDEVSMLHHFRLDMIDQICRRFKESQLPFGGMQVVLCGDFFQLPPIQKGDEETRFIDQSRAWEEMEPKVCYLDEQHRHIDDDLLAILNSIRTNKISDDTFNILQTRYEKDIQINVNPTKLFTHNVDADVINRKELSALPGKTFRYCMQDDGPLKLIMALKNSCLAQEELYLKKGASVMFIKNDKEHKYVNGTLGTIVNFDEDGMPVVKITEGKKITAYPETWSMEEDGRILAKIRQIPLRLAWAITVHKSQGMSLDAAEVDLSKSFVEGMGYVALSRVRTIHGLKLLGFNKMSLQVNPKALELDKDLQARSKQSLFNLDLLSINELKNNQKIFLNSIRPCLEEQELSTYEKTRALVEQKLSIPEIAKCRGKKEGTILAHLETLIEQGENFDLDHLRPESERFEKIKTAFQQTNDTRLAPVREILGEDYSYDELRLVRILLQNKT